MVHAGMEVRMLQIPSDTGKHGAFRRLHGLSGGKELADQLRERIRHQHGTAFRTFIQAVSERQAEHTAWLKSRSDNSPPPCNPRMQEIRWAAPLPGSHWSPRLENWQPG